MIYWALLLHIYQPPFQNLEILQKIDDESYSKVLDVFLKFPKAKFTLNMNGSLTELLYNYKFHETLDKIKELAQKDQLRFTGSGMYHPILPLLPPSEVIRQITLNEEYNKEVLGSFYANPKGFFPPEMAISKGELNILEKLDYKWVIMSGIACPKEWPTDFYYTYKSLPVLFRDDIVSNEISFNKFKTPIKFLSKLQTMFEDNQYVITAMDGETYGHHIENYAEDFLGTIFTELDSQEDIQIIFLDDIQELFQKKDAVIPINSSWSTMAKNLTERNPYPLWSAPTNELHRVLNQLRNLTIKLFQQLERHAAQIPEDHLEFYNNARKSLDKGENSDTAWWANDNFNQDLIYRGSQFLVRSFLNTYKALFSVAIGTEAIVEVRHSYKDFKGIYDKLLQFLANNMEERSRFKQSRSRIDDLTTL